VEAPESYLCSSRFFRGVTVEAASAAGVGATAITVTAMIEGRINITIGARRVENRILKMAPAHTGESGPTSLESPCAKQENSRSTVR
jgi:hypothetical protein